MKKTVALLLLILIVFQTNKAQAQDIIKSTNLSTLKVDQLNDADILNIKDQLQVNNLTIEQAMPMALNKGMTTTEFNKLKSRLENFDFQDTNSSSVNNLRQQVPIENNKIKDGQNLFVFGSELFDNPTLNFEPNLKIASPLNYILGPGDELQIDVYGIQEYNTTVLISVEGKVNIKNVGKISISNLSLEAATQKIKIAIARVYTTVATEQSKVEVSLSRIRTIKITLIGSKQPGNYSISSLGTVYNALFLGGGPGKNETYRNIELIRDNKIIQKIDIYNFLVNGNQSDNVSLKDNDVIRIPAYKNRVTLHGEVKRPGIFEMKEGETFTDLLKFASGFNDMAYKASVNVIQKTDKELKVKDLNSSEFNSYQPKSGDTFKVSEILNRYENRITIEGAVLRPDSYAFNEGMKISNLIEKASGLKDGAYTKRAIIRRTKPDLSIEILNVNLAKALNGDSISNIILKKEDIITVYSIIEFEEDFKISIDGEINKPGEYQFYENITLNDLLILSGGLSGGASKRVEIARMIKPDEMDVNDPKTVELINLVISTDNNEQVNNFKLEPFDVISIRKIPFYEKPQIVTLTGAVNFSGNYVLTNRKDKVYDIIQRAGGLTSLADPDGVKILRPIDLKQLEAMRRVNLKVNENDSIQDQIVYNNHGERTHITIPIDWREITKNQNSSTNIKLSPGDIIEVNTFKEGVQVTGNVLLTSEIPYKEGKGLKYYINAVGGVDAKGWLRKAYVVYPNGEAAVSKSFMFIPIKPTITPGAQIIIPQKPDRKKYSTFETVSLVSVISSLALLIITAFK